MKKIASIFCIIFLFICLGCSENRQVNEGSETNESITLTKEEYIGRCKAIWTAQVVSVLLGWEFEHKVGAVEWSDSINYGWSLTKIEQAGGYGPLDDDWFYEMSTLFGFEKFGPEMTVQQLGTQWLENRVGTWGATAQARKNMEKGILPPESGSPRHNRLWFTMGSQNRCDLYGMLNPGMPNEAAAMARRLGKICSYAEGSDGGVFMATIISLGFYEKDHQQLLKKAALVLDKETPHRQCIDMVIEMAEAGHDYYTVANAVMDKWQIEYPATNNTVVNAGIAAIALWYGEGDFMKSLNVAFMAADFTDADCNATAPATAIAAMYGMDAIPAHLLKPINGRIVGTNIGDIQVNPAIDISLDELANRTAEVGIAVLANSGANIEGQSIQIDTPKEIITQEAELFHPNQFTQWWNPDWKLERSSYGAPGGGHRGVRGGTFLDDGILATYPRDEVRGVKMSQTVKIEGGQQLKLEVGADAGRTWKLEVYIGNNKVLEKLIDGGKPLEWPDIDETGYPSPQTDYQACKKIRTYETITIDLAPYDGQEKTIRLYQSTLVRNKFPGNAYWKSADVM